MPGSISTSGISELDRLLGGVFAGDNIVWEADSGAPVGRFMSSFVQACEAEKAPIVFVSFNHSPQTIAFDYARLVSPERFTLVDCFTSGKGNDDGTFMEFYRSGGKERAFRTIHVEKPVDSGRVLESLSGIGSGEGIGTRYIFDSLTGMLDLWGDEEPVLRLFGYLCPKLCDLNTIAYWMMEREAHSQEFLAKIRHITQVVIEVAVARGIQTITVRKAVNRPSIDVGVPQRFEITDGRLVISAESREGRELVLLTKMSEALGSALEPNAFFEQTMNVLASELGMVRGTLVLMDRVVNKLRIAAAHGLTAAERARGEYAVGEGVTGSVVARGQAEVVPDISRDSRFLDRTAARKTDAGWPIAFICVPLKVDGEVVGALSVDRTHAVQATLEKDLRLLTIVAAIVSQVLKINRMVKVEKEELLARDERLLEDLRGRYRLEMVVGQSEAIRKVLATAAAAAKSTASVLITGETGTGKELIANVVHYNSARADGPLVKVNCGALPETLLESELFGHVKGAFTGATRDRKGRFELADGGTLFLDEVSEMSPRLQVNLLRVLQEMEFEPVGGTRSVRVNVRVVAATNKDLNKGIQEGWFRKDLFYRLNVVPIQLPPLRERREDIPLLIDRFLELYGRKNDKAVTKLSREVLDLLVAYDWPGNVRELENCIEHAVVMSPGETISKDVLPPEIVGGTTSATRRRNMTSNAEDSLRSSIENLCATSNDLGAALSHLTRVVEEAVLNKAMKLGLNQRDLAKMLGMSRTTLRKKLRDSGIK